MNAGRAPAARDAAPTPAFSYAARLGSPLPRVPARLPRFVCGAISVRATAPSQSPDIR
jgi:hypothetical protein